MPSALALTSNAAGAAPERQRVALEPKLDSRPRALSTLRLSIVTRPMPTLDKREQDRPRRAARADHHRVLALEIEPGDRRIEAAGIGVGADQRAVLGTQHRVDRADRPRTSPRSST
jgi:hypothetical protein